MLRKHYLIMLCVPILFLFGCVKTEIILHYELLLVCIKCELPVVKTNAHAFNKENSLMIWNLSKIDEQGIYIVLKS